MKPVQRILIVLAFACLALTLVAVFRNDMGVKMLNDSASGRFFLDVAHNWKTFGFLAFAFLCGASSLF